MLGPDSAFNTLRDGGVSSFLESALARVDER